MSLQRGVEIGVNQPDLDHLDHLDHLLPGSVRLQVVVDELGRHDRSRRPERHVARHCGALLGTSLQL